MLQPKMQTGTGDSQTAQEISICGKTFLADVSGALYWPAEDVLIVADLHLEKGSAFARSGQFLPPYDTRETLKNLATVIDRYQASAVIALGDSFHDRAAGTRMCDDDIAALQVLQDACEWIWITGNHDPEIPECAGGHAFPAISLAGLTLRHEPRNGAVTHEIAGHLHPAARLVRNGVGLRRPCFIGNGLRLVLPAFGTFTGGLNILDDAFQPLFGTQGFKVWMMGQEGLYPVATRLLRPD